MADTNITDINEPVVDTVAEQVAPQWLTLQSATAPTELMDTPLVEASPVTDLTDTSPIIEPEVIAEPVIEEKIEAPQITTPEVTTIEVGKEAESTQKIKAQDLANKATEDAQITVSQEKAFNDFNVALQSDNKDELKRLIKDFPQLKGSFTSSVKMANKNKSNIAYVNKFSGLTDNQMLVEVNNGNMVVWSEQYKLLSPEQRARYQAFQAQNQAITNTEKFDSSTGDKVTDSNTITNGVTELKSFDLRKTYSELTNSKAITDSRNKTTSLKGEIQAKDRELNKVKKEAESLFSTKQLQDAYIADRQESIIDAKNTLIDSYNLELGTYESLKSDALLELDFLKYEDQQAQDKYNAKLAAYTAERKESITLKEQEANRAFIQENSKLASDRSLQNSKDLATHNQEIRESGDTGGKYIDDGKWTISYIKGGEIISTLTWIWKTVWTSSDAEYTYTVKDNEDGTRTVYGLPKKKGLWVFTETYNVDGKNSTPYVNWIGTWDITSYGWAHDKFQWLDIDGTIGDPVPTPLSWKVISTEWNPAYWNTIVVELEDGNIIRYSHLDEKYLKEGDTFGKGSIIGTLGNTGNVLKMDGNKPSKDELSKWFGSHLDIVTTDKDGNIRSARETEVYLNSTKDIIDDWEIKELTKSQSVFFNQQIYENTWPCFSSKGIRICISWEYIRYII